MNDLSMGMWSLLKAFGPVLRMVIFVHTVFKKLTVAASQVKGEIGKCSFASNLQEFPLVAEELILTKKCNPL